MGSLTRRAARERSARQEAERIGEESTASMYAALQQVEQAQVLIDQTTDMVLMLDERYRVTYANASAQHRLELATAPGGLLGTHARRLLDPTGWRRWRSAGGPHLASTGTWHADLELRAGDRSRIATSAVVIAHPSSARTPRRWSVVARDVSAERALRLELQHRAEHDALTGLGNRGRFFSVLQEALDDLGSARRRPARRASARSGAPVDDVERSTLGLLFVDLDGFKGVNDRWGHEVGDRLLQLVARELRACLRVEDVPCRLGGDEFTAVLPDLRSPQDAVGVAERVLAALASPVVDGVVMPVSASVGVATCTRSPRFLAGVHGERLVSPAPRPEELVRRADEAMYTAKRAGRGRVAAAEPLLFRGDVPERSRTSHLTPG